MQIKFQVETKTQSISYMPSYQIRCQINLANYGITTNQLLHAFLYFLNLIAKECDALKLFAS